MTHAHPAEALADALEAALRDDRASALDDGRGYVWPADDRPAITLDLDVETALDVAADLITSGDPDLVSLADRLVDLATEARSR